MKYLFWEHCRQGGSRQTDSFCVKFGVNCFNNICENSYWKIKNAVISTVWKLVMPTVIQYQQTCLFSDVKRQISLVLKVTAKMYHLFSEWKTKQKIVDVILFSEDVAIIWTSSHCHATLLLSGDGFIQAVWLLSGSLHTFSFCMLFTYICSIYIVHLFFKWQGGAAFELE